VTWHGRHRAPLREATVHPRPEQDPIPLWIAVGGNPASVVRAGTLGLPLAVAIIGGMPERFAPLVELYRESARAAGHDPAELDVSLNVHGYIADDSQRAADEWFPGYAEAMTRIGRERGFPPVTRPNYEASRTLRGHLAVGDAQEVAEKILFQHEIFGHTRHLLQMAFGTLPHAQALRAIELLGTEVAPVVRTEVSRRQAPAAS
jgi:alkanesulfonate monooxygenase SsuD/methylene tetrahydromethanopterin reductase-like flavin-dependent oxidoreductase (luciferase family)